VVSASTRVVHLVARIERFCAQTVRLEGSQLSADLIELRRGMNLLEVKFSELAAAFAATDEYDEEGSVSPIHWIRHQCHLGGGAAADRVAVGQQMQNLPESAEAVAGGKIGFAHLAMIARTASALAETGSNMQFDETPLLEKAKEFSVGRFRVFCEHQRHANDPAGYAAEQAQGVEERTLSMSSGDGGRVWVRGVLDAEGGAVLRTALEPLAKPVGKGDDRKLGRRFADALVELAGHSLDNGRTCKSRRHSRRCCGARVRRRGTWSSLYLSLP
jgi:hypothetical protein